MHHSTPTAISRQPSLPFTPPPDELPPEILWGKRWVGWKYKTGPERVKSEKPPVNPRTGGNADIKYPGTWGTFDQASDAVDRFELAGVGVMMGRRYDLTGIDLDNCTREPWEPDLDEWAARILDKIPDTYGEFSPSGRGVRLFLAGMLPAGHPTFGRDVEIYSEKRYLTVTGIALPGRPRRVAPGGDRLDWLAREFLPASRSSSAPPTIRVPFSGSDAELIRRAMAARNGAGFARLWHGDTSRHRSASHADLDLCLRLGFWCGGPDLERVDRLFRGSGLMRGKWDERRGTTTYGGLTLEAMRKFLRVTRAEPVAFFLPRREPDPKSSEPEQKNPDPEQQKNPQACSKNVRSVFTRREKSLTDDEVYSYVKAMREAFGRPVRVSCRSFLTELGLSKTTVADSLRTLVASGRLVLIEKGRYGAKHRRKSSLYDVPSVSPPATGIPATEVSPELQPCLTPTPTFAPAKNPAPDNP